MKTNLLFLLIMLAYNAAAQDQQYYNWDWKACKPEDARFVSMVTKTDSGWVRRDFYLSTKKSQMKGLYEDSSLKTRNGWFRYFYVNERIAEQGNYVHGKKDGLWLSYYYTGAMKDSIVYRKGAPDKVMSWHSNGASGDSIDINVEGTGVHVSWFNNGQPALSGRIVNWKKEKKWQYFHKNGKLAALEEYDQDKLLSRQYFDEQGMPLDTNSRDRQAEFKGGKKRWNSFLSGNLEFPQGVTLKNTEKITVVVNAAIDEEGNIIDAYISVPVHPKFDDEAIRVFKKSPKWIPAVSHNRNVVFHIRQSITFGQYND